MSGPAEGKLELKKAKVYLYSREKKFLLDAFVYIHIKGYALAKVTHLDIEHKILENIILPKKGEFLGVRGIKDGIEIDLGKEREVEFERKKVNVRKIEVLHPYLDKILGKAGKARTWIGGKFGGIYIGFRKDQIIMLERIAREKLNFPA